METLKQLIYDADVDDALSMFLGINKNNFIDELMQLVSNDKKLQKCEVKSIIMAAVTAARLGLTFNPLYSTAYLEAIKIDAINYVAQLIIGYKGFIDLVYKTNEFETFNCKEVKEGEIESFNYLTDEIIINQQAVLNNINSNTPTIGYIAYYKLKNGLQKYLFMSVEDMKQHALKYSKSYHEDRNSFWHTNFKDMALKTVLKMLIVRYAPQSTNAKLFTHLDCAVIQSLDAKSYYYADNPSWKKPKHTLIAEKKISVIEQRIINHIQRSNDVSTLEQCLKHIKNDDIMAIYKERLEFLKK